ncbi:MAG: amylosucrase, partial [Lachnospiraceae bacterium]|nr:amylosucrase [Lachnospiraceae bacterium]
MGRESWEKEFADRFRSCEDELRWLYFELYHGDRKAYEYFSEMLYRAYKERPESLKNMDRAREAEPDWYRGHEMTGMLMYVNAFAKNLKGVRKKLDYV